MSLYPEEQNTNSCMRKTMSFDNSVSDFSQQSVVFAMERFARAVANMDDTVMVPCKLMDVPVGSDPEMDQRVPRRSRALIRQCQAADLHSLYSMLNSLKNQLVWGTTRTETDPQTEPHSSIPGKSKSATCGSKSASKSARRPSINSMTSTASVSSGIGYSDSDSESGLDQESTEDSGPEPEAEPEAEREPEGEESIQRVANQFRRHLAGLHQCLEQLSDAAQYLTHRYQVEIGNAD